MSTSVPLIASKYQILQRMGAKKSSLFVGKNIKNQEHVVIKLEQCKTKNPTLQFESRVLSKFKKQGK